MNSMILDTFSVQRGKKSENIRINISVKCRERIVCNDFKVWKWKNEIPFQDENAHMDRCFRPCS